MSSGDEDRQEQNGDTEQDDTFDKANFTLHSLPDPSFFPVLVTRSKSFPHGVSPKRSKRLLSGRAKVAADRMRLLSEKKFSTIGIKDENQERGNWDNPVQFVLSCFGYAVGLGNIWRFPYLVYRNGGGAFLIPYLLMLFCCGLPLMLMELALGQFTSEGPLTVWKLVPLYKGVGVGMLICSMILATYYNLITGWALYYLYLSFRDPLPWICCDSAWADERCTSSPAAISCPSATALANESLPAQSSADQFFHKVVLGISQGFGHLGGLQPHLTFALFISWLIVFLVLMKGIKSIGKTVYFTSTFPYIILTLLFARSVIEPGAIDGIKFYLKPDLSVLFRAQVWGDAASQIFYSTGVCQGGAISLASYNRFSHNLYRDALMVTIGNSLTSIFSGFVVFSILGFMARSQGSTIDEVVTSGPGLTFIAYPQAITVIPWAPFWSALFFIMLVTLALSSMFPTVENIATALVDQFPRQLRPFKFWVTLLLCCGLFAMGIPLTTGGGMYLLQLLDTYGVGYALLVLGIVEVSVVAWRYGANKLLDNIEAMLNRRLSNVWYYLWKFVTPTVLVFAIGFQIWELKPLEYGEYKFPPFVNRIGWCLTSLPLLPIPIYAIYKLCSKRRPNESLSTAFTRLTSPQADFVPPAIAKYRVTPRDLERTPSNYDDNHFSSFIKEPIK